MVRPDRVELPTFWFVAMNARRINNLAAGTTVAVSSQSLLVFSYFRPPRQRHTRNSEQAFYAGGGHSIGHNRATRACPSSSRGMDVFGRLQAKRATPAIPARSRLHMIISPASGLVLAVHWFPLLRSALRLGDLLERGSHRRSRARLGHRRQAGRTYIVAAHATVRPPSSVQAEDPAPPVGPGDPGATPRANVRCLGRH